MKLNPFLLLPTLLLCLTGSLAFGDTEKGPPNVFFTYAGGDGVYVLSGDGTLDHKVIGGYYYQAALSPDKSKVACVYDKDFQITVFSLDANFETSLKPKTIHNDLALSQVSGMTPVACPVWSADGQKIYFINLNHLIVYDYQQQKTSPVFDFPEGQSGGQADGKGLMRLSQDGGALYCLLTEGRDKLDFWNVALDSGQGTQEGMSDSSLLEDSKLPSGLPGDVIENLFGSVENPVSRPIASADGRYYFYFLKGHGFLAHNVIQGYDRTTKEKFEVATLGTSLYAP